MNPCNGWLPLDPDDPTARRPMTRDELLEHQQSCPSCREPWFANPREGA